MQVVILAGGLATRLGPLTERVPKSLLPGAGGPFLAWQLELVARSGYERVLRLTGPLAEPIRAFAGDGGSNELVGTDTGKIVEAFRRVQSGASRPPQIPSLWDGRAADRILGVMAERL